MQKCLKKKARSLNAFTLDNKIPCIEHINKLPGL